ncbi:MAG: hypothetical protein COA47_02855 [Robiginitomaculum sp.]|nr:MAG: hypothetical protein COA47_02855 [Robiginitomaculum sp.]
MSANIHYEVFVKRHKKAGWNLTMACEDRTEALETAKTERDASEETSVRVTKESFDEINNVFHSVSIFSKGPENHQRKLRENNRMDPPCSTPSDLYTLHARRTLGRALGPWLKRNGISVIELLHRPDLAETLAAAGFDRQHAIQKVAIAQAGAQECSVQHIVLRLTELADKSTDRLRKLDKSNALPGFQKKGYSATFVATRAHSEPGFALRHALAQAMMSMKKWDEKFSFLAGCVSDALVEGEGFEVSIEMLDEFLSETASLPYALDALVDGKNLGERLDRITDILIGNAPQGGTNGAQMLAIAISSKRLPVTQSALSARVFRELSGPRRLFPDDFDREVELNRTLASRMTRVDQALAPIDRLAEAFASRSARLLENETIQTLLGTCHNNASEEIRKLVQFEESIVGDHNKVKLASYLRGVIGAHKTRTWFAHGPDKPLSRIAKIAHAQRIVRSSSFAPADRDELFAQLDALCAEVVQDTDVLNQLEQQKKPAIEIAYSLMKLCDAGILTVGTCSDDVCRRVLKQLRSQQVRTALQAGDQATINTTRIVGRMMDQARTLAK